MKMNRILPLVLFLLLLFTVGPKPVTATSIPSLAPPEETVKLIFIHHSVGENWLTDGYGNLGAALGNQNYFVSDTNYGWGPDSIGDRTNIPEWMEWFRSAGTPTYMAALFNESDQHSAYTRPIPDPGGQNQVVMFKSCFPNSALEGNPNDPPDPEWGLTVGYAKYVYNEVLHFFATRPDKLFIVITAPPLLDDTHAANARAFNLWLVNDWLEENGYTQPNVAVFDFYNILTGPDNHHRYIHGAVEHVYTPGMDTLSYPSPGPDEHPNPAGSQKATSEFIPLLNYYYSLWSGSTPGRIFSDVPSTNWAWSWIERLYYAGITTGCAADPPHYCPGDSVTRAQMAVFLERGIHGSAYQPPAPGGTVFQDVATSHWAAGWIENLFTDGITTGCSQDPSRYCPDGSVTRDQMAVFLLRARHGAFYTPPPAMGIFSDVPLSHWAAPWIEQLYAEGITTGCSTSPLQYCPGNPVTRDQMAVFLVRTFNLP